MSVTAMEQLHRGARSRLTYDKFSTWWKFQPTSGVVGEARAPTTEMRAIMMHLACYQPSKLKIAVTVFG